MYSSINSCLCCGSKDLVSFLDLEKQPLANNLNSNIEEQYEQFPLLVNYCKNCWHSQLSISVDPKILFKDYFYVTGTSKTMHSYCEELAEILFKKSEGKKCKILDIASNDGTFLEKFKKYDWQLYGVDPAANLAESSREKGIKTFVNFFGSENINFDTKFDFVTALNVFAHVPNPFNFLRECKNILNEDGRIIIQTSQRDMVERRQFDTVYHEHISFFSTQSMKTLCKRAGLFLNDILLQDIHGGSYVFIISNKNYESESLKLRLEQENKSGRYSESTYATFQKDLVKLSKSVKDKIKNNTLIAFGAAAKGIVSLHALDLNPECIIDENPLKIGKFLQKKNVPVVGIDVLNNYEENLDILILPWNFEKEIATKIKKIRGNRDNLICIFKQEKEKK